MKTKYNSLKYKLSYKSHFNDKVTVVPVSLLCCVLKKIHSSHLGVPMQSIINNKFI